MAKNKPGSAQRAVKTEIRSAPQRFYLVPHTKLEKRAGHGHNETRQIANRTERFEDQREEGERVPAPLQDRGAGSHGTVYLAERLTVVKDLKIPEALTGGDDIEDTFAQAADCLADAIAGRIARRDEIPPPSRPKRGQHLISVPLYLAPKLALYLAMRERRLSNTALAERLGVSETVIRRMLNPKHTTKPENIQAALTALWQAPCRDGLGRGVRALRRQDLH